MNPIQIRRFLRRFGVDLCRRMPRVVDLLTHHRIEAFFDIGGNTGQTGTHLRRWGYTGRIISFEPVRGTFSELAKAASGDRLWDVVNVGIGDRDGTALINVSQRSDYSSLRAALPILGAFDEQSAYVAQEEITLRRLDSVFDEHRGGAERVFVKVDTQGYEREVLAGASGVLDRIQGVQLELSLVPMYEGEATFLEVANLLERSGFTIALVEPVSYDPASSSLLQVDGFFVRS